MAQREETIEELVADAIQQYKNSVAQGQDPFKHTSNLEDFLLRQGDAIAEHDITSAIYEAIVIQDDVIDKANKEVIRALLAYPQNHGYVINWQEDTINISGDIYKQINDMLYGLYVVNDADNSSDVQRGESIAKRLKNLVAMRAQQTQDSDTEEEVEAVEQEAKVEEKEASDNTNNFADAEQQPNNSYGAAESSHARSTSNRYNPYGR